MANPNQAFGLKPVRHLTGGDIRSNVYPIAASAGAIYKGDPVKHVNDGSIAIDTAGSTTTIGVFAGCEYDDAAGQHHYSPYWPAISTATNVVGYVYDDPDIIYQIQSDATGAAAADIHNGADVEIVAGSAKTGVSATNLDVSAGLGTTGKTFRILRIVNNGENVAGAYSVVEVMFNEHVMKGVVSGVGGI